MDGMTAKAFLVSNMALVISATVGILTFCGFGYYYTFLAGFGLKPGILDISATEMVVFGCMATISTFWLGIRQNLLMFVVEVGLLLFLTAVGALVCKKVSWAADYARKMKPYAPTIGGVADRIVKAFLLLLPLVVASLSGFALGERDAQLLKKVKPSRTRCYVTPKVIVNGVLVAQDNSKTILYAQNRTYIIRNDELISVGPCPRTAPTYGASK